jgi:hypothetical protein
VFSSVRNALGQIFLKTQEGKMEERKRREKL